MEKDNVTISREEYNRLKMMANIDVELLTQLMERFKDIKEGRIRRVK
jgi:PHD/YefM family antitoxin component YafN of YafNO toxin-antitoxin module